MMSAAFSRLLDGEEQREEARRRQATSSGAPPLYNNEHEALPPKILHPAELSGASSDPKLRLMGMPGEIRDNIFRHLLLFHKEIQLDFDCTTNWTSADHFYSTRRLVRAVGDPTLPGLITGNRDEVCQKLDLRILRVCRQACKEGRLILYSENRWFFRHARAFQSLFLDYPDPAIGAMKAALIRDLTVWTTKDNLSYLEMKYLDFIDFLCTRLPALQHLQVILSYNVFKDRAPDRTRFMCMTGINHNVVSMAARITLRHPSLKKAIYSGRSGRIREETSISPRLRQFEVIFMVDMVPAGPSVKDFPLVDAITNGKFLADDEEPRSEWFATEDVILDCDKVRNTQLGSNEGNTPAKFALPSTAMSSEPVVAPDSGDLGTQNCDGIHMDLGELWNLSRSEQQRLLT